MITTLQNVSENQVDFADETSKFALGVGGAMAALVGLWGMTCIASALISAGFMSVLQSYFIALIG